jgi:hypothetical protein
MGLLVGAYLSANQGVHLYNSEGQKIATHIPDQKICGDIVRLAKTAEPWLKWHCE